MSGLFSGLGRGGQRRRWRFFLQQPVAGEGASVVPPVVVIMNHPALRPQQ